MFGVTIQIYLFTIYSYGPSLLNLLRMMSLKRKQNGSSDMASLLLLSPCRCDLFQKHSGQNAHTKNAKYFLGFSVIIAGNKWGINDWIFLTSVPCLFFSILKQESTDYLDRGTTTNFSRKGPSTIAKIKEALNFMRNQQFEVLRAFPSSVSFVWG